MIGGMWLGSEAQGSGCSSCTVRGTIHNDYDSLGNLTASTDELLRVTNFAYDANQNLSSTTAHLDSSTPVTTAYTYNSLGEPLTVTDPLGNVTTNTYDANGNLLTVTVAFMYDPFGRRIQKNSSTGTIAYLYDGSNIVAEVDMSGSLVARYTQGEGLDRPLAQLRPGTTYYYEADGLGSITSLSSGAGALTSTYNYDAFGHLAASTGTVTNPFSYTGREFESETGLYYLRARYLDPMAGRFLNEDPIGFAGGANFYGYVRNNPLIFVDPMGLCVTIFVEDRVYSWTGLSVHGLISVSSDKTPLTFWGYTLENANAGDSHNKPPIPDGKYAAFIRGDHDPNRIELSGLKGYQNVQIHNGNYPRDFKGCIGVGTSNKTDFIGDSVIALNQILNVIAADGTGCIKVVILPIMPPVETPHCNGAKCGT